MGYLSRRVYQDRLTRIHRELEDAELAALVVLTPENFLYVSGYFLDVQPWERPVAAIVPRDADPFLVMHELSTNHVRYATEHRSMWIPEVHFYAEHYPHAAPDVSHAAVAADGGRPAAAQGDPARAARRRRDRRPDRRRAVAAAGRGARVRVGVPARDARGQGRRGARADPAGGRVQRLGAGALPGASRARAPARGDRHAGGARDGRRKRSGGGRTTRSRSGWPG